MLSALKKLGGFLVPFSKTSSFFVLIAKLDFCKVTIECSSIYSFTEITYRRNSCSNAKATDIKSIDFLFKIREKGIAQSNEIKICIRNSL